MFAKCWEIHKIFLRAEKGDISPFQEMPWWKFCRIFFVVVSFEIVFLIIWLSYDPPRSIMVITDNLNLLAIHRCQVRFTGIWAALQFSYFGLLLAWGAYLAYQTRDIWAKYNYPNESRSILLSIYNISFCGMILIPLVTALDASPDTLFFLTAVATVFPTTFALIVVHGPKIISFLGSSLRGKNNTQEHVTTELTDRDIHSHHRDATSQTAKLLIKPHDHDEKASASPDLRDNRHSPELLSKQVEEACEDPVELSPLTGVKVLLTKVEKVDAD